METLEAGLYVCNCGRGKHKSEVKCMNCKRTCPLCGKYKHKDKRICVPCQHDEDQNNFNCKCEGGFVPDPSFKLQCVNCHKPKFEDLNITVEHEMNYRYGYITPL